MHSTFQSRKLMHSELSRMSQTSHETCNLCRKNFKVSRICYYYIIPRIVIHIIIASAVASSSSQGQDLSQGLGQDLDRCLNQYLSPVIWNESLGKLGWTTFRWFSLICLKLGAMWCHDKRLTKQSRSSEQAIIFRLLYLRCIGDESYYRLFFGLCHGT